MSNLRKHLQAEKDAYQSTRFPGNLADEILPRQVLEYRRPEIWRDRLWRIVGVAVAAAAMLAIAIPVWHKLQRRCRSSSAMRISRRSSRSRRCLWLSETESLPDEPIETAPTETGGFIPEYQTMSFPTIPSFSDSPTTDQNNQTSKESA